MLFHIACCKESPAFLRCAWTAGMFQPVFPTKEFAHVSLFAQFLAHPTAAEAPSAGLLKLSSALQHAQAACKDSTAVAVDAVDLLSQQYFFTSTKLASLATEAEIMTKVCAGCTAQLHKPEHVLYIKI